jgi:DNA-directed RNA polymerase subunit RPC12/RpoP
MEKRIPVIPVLRCPNCGADRLIPLTFPVFHGESGPKAGFFRHPLAKCAGCGERIFARVIARQPQPSDRETD